MNGNAPDSSIGHSSAASRLIRAHPPSAPVSMRSPSAADQTWASQKTTLVERSATATASAAAWYSRNAPMSPVARIDP
jgi:hypothetical protein